MDENYEVVRGKRERAGYLLVCDILFSFFVRKGNASVQYRKQHRGTQAAPTKNGCFPVLQLTEYYVAEGRVYIGDAEVVRA